MTESETARSAHNVYSVNSVQPHYQQLCASAPEPLSSRIAVSVLFVTCVAGVILLGGVL